MAEDQQQQNVTTTMAPPPPPPRRPRVREVSSRFMSPIVSSSSSGDLHLPSSKCPLPKHSVSTSTELHPKYHHQRHHQHQQQRSHSAQRRQQESEPLSSADENRLETVRSMDTPLGTHSSKLGFSLQRKPQRAVKLFKENNGSGEHQNFDSANLRASNTGKLLSRSNSLTRSRPDTPIAHGMDRINPRSLISTQNSHRTNTFTISSVASTAAAKLVQSQVSSSISSNISDCDSKLQETLAESSTTSSDYSETGSCCSSPIPILKSKIRSVPECRSSMPEADQFSSMSNRLHRGNSGIGDSLKVASSPIYRSLSFEQPFSSPTKSVYRSSSVLPKPHLNSMKSCSGVNLPPHPSNTTVWAETKKGKKILSHQENVHSLRMLHNRYLQWRYTNAKAEVTRDAQTLAAEQSLYGLGCKISEMRDAVKAKRADLEQLKRTIAVSTILETQIPYLDEWSALEGDYSSSLAGVTKALQDASLRLPIVGNVKADIREMDGALNAASNMMETMSSHIESFLPKAEEMDGLASELAAVVSRERALIEECGDLLSKTNMLQVEECSLRGQLMQLKQNTHNNQANEEQA